jgi:hypothetical protein
VDIVRTAAKLRTRGFGIVWLKPGEKRPKRRGWTTKSQEPGDYRPGDNLGLLTGAISGNLVILDLDSAEAFALADQFLPPTGMVEGRPGKPRSHRCYVVTEIPPEMVSKAKGANAAGFVGPWKKKFQHRPKKVILEFLGTGGHAVVPPSRHESGERRVWYGPDGQPVDEPGEPAVVPMQVLWEATCRLAEACGWRPKGWPGGDWAVRPSGVVVPVGARVRRARAYLAQVDPAISGQGGHDATYRAARTLVNDFGLTYAEAWPLLVQFNRRCQPPWSEPELRHKLESAIAAGPSNAYPRGCKLNSRLPTKHLTDRGNAQRLAQRHGQDLRFCHPWGKWLVWDRRRWREDAGDLAPARMKETIAALFDWAHSRIVALRQQKEGGLRE